jgi:hypothetical protein
VRVGGNTVKARSTLTRRYLDLKLPARFALEFQRDDGTWMQEAVCAAARFEHLEDGSYICSDFSSGLWIRCTELHADHFLHVDGTGVEHRYRLVDLSKRYPGS